MHVLQPFLKMHITSQIEACHALRVARLQACLKLWTALFSKQFKFSFFWRKLNSSFLKSSSDHLHSSQSSLCQLQFLSSERCICSSPCSTGRLQRSMQSFCTTPSASRRKLLTFLTFSFAQLCYNWKLATIYRFIIAAGTRCFSHDLLVIH